MSTNNGFHAPGSCPGETVCWQMTGKIKYPKLLKALQDCGLSEKVARKMLPRNAFIRASRKLSEKRIIRTVSDDTTHLAFQLTREEHAEGEQRLDYYFEAILKLDKTSGVVSCEQDRDLARRAQEYLDHETEERSASDVTAVIKRLFDQHADLFPVLPKKGSFYFVPQQYSGFVGQVAAFVEKAGGELRRIPAGVSAAGGLTIKKAVSEGMERMITAHREAIDKLNEEAREGTLERAGKRIEETRFKLQAYAQYLGDGQQALLDELKKAEDELKAKAGELISEDAEESVV